MVGSSQWAVIRRIAEGEAFSRVEATVVRRLWAMSAWWGSLRRGMGPPPWVRRRIGDLGIVGYEWIEMMEMMERVLLPCEMLALVYILSSGKLRLV